MYNDLRNISIKGLFGLQAERFEQYHNTLKRLKSNPLLKGKQATPIESLSFGEVITIKQILSNPNINGLTRIFEMVFKLKKNKFSKVKVVEFYQVFNWIKEQVTTINEREKEMLTSKPDGKLKEAGIDDLRVFGELDTLISLAEKFGKSPQEIENWTYSLVFSLMYHGKVSNDINKRYAKILNR